MYYSRFKHLACNSRLVPPKTAKMYLWKLHVGLKFTATYGFSAGSLSIAKVFEYAVQKVRWLSLPFERFGSGLTVEFTQWQAFKSVLWKAKSIVSLYKLSCCDSVDEILGTTHKTLQKHKMYITITVLAVVGSCLATKVFIGNCQLYTCIWDECRWS